MIVFERIGRWGREGEDQAIVLVTALNLPKIKILTFSFYTFRINQLRIVSYSFHILKKENPGKPWLVCTGLDGGAGLVRTFRYTYFTQIRSIPSTLKCEICL